MIPTISTFAKRPLVTLVGAGPGDPDLLTLKALNAINSADVVLFDALVSKAILDLIPRETPSFSVGKRSGAHGSTQDEINELIVELAYQFGHVVRLKGGDPFVFGRGAEECEFATSHGVDCVVVPGISSAIAVPAAANIPVTARGVSEGFWVITGTTKTGKLSDDVALAARSSSTVIVLMGIGKIEQIMELFSREQKGSTPVAVIQNGTLPDQRSVVGTVDTIVELMKNQDINSPGVIVIGDVVRYASTMNEQVNATILRNYE